MKSHENDFLEVARNIYLDACDACAVKVSYRDLKTIRSRVKDEGISFLTITLPSFCADFERSLASGIVDPSGFRCFRKSGAIPAFLQGMLGLIFNQETGRINDVEINDSPNTFSSLVASVRQICLAFKKIELPCTPERERMALENFIEIERSFELFSLPREENERFSLVSSVLWDDVTSDIHLDDVVPRHGPGATAERIYGNRKYTWQFWYDRLEPYFHLLGDAYSANCRGWHRFPNEFEQVSIVPSEKESPVRVVLVPKTLKSPRVIAIEPCCMQYAQQGLRRVIYNMIESHWLSAGHINFRDQSINQSLALIASSNGRLATIDLSDASDRVPLDLALAMFNGNPDLRDAIDACRSTHAMLPGDRLVGPLRKFASMGSALCFPIEAMYFYTLCVMASLEFHNLPVSRKNINDCSRDVYVYGDDIIVPTDITATVLDHLEKYNCKVNNRKSFWTGRFRESCGVDAFNGSLVTPVYIGTSLPKDRRQATEFLSWVETCRHFEKKGFMRTAQSGYNNLESVFGELPCTADESGIPGRGQFRVGEKPPRKRWNPDLQRLEVRCWVSSPVYRTDPLEGHAALQKCLLRLQSSNDEIGTYRTRMKAPIDRYLEVASQEALIDPHHLERTAQHGAVAIKRRWVPNDKLLGLLG